MTLQHLDLYLESMFTSSFFEIVKAAATTPKMASGADLARYLR
jgi:hypothetical protein